MILLLLACLYTPAERARARVYETCRQRCAVVDARPVYVAPKCGCAR